MNKKIDLYTFIYNDEDILPFFLNYYSFVDRMTFIDSESTDKSLEIIKEFAKRESPIVRIAQTGITFWDQESLHNLRNEIWRESDMDLVLFPDCDEIFYTSNGIQNYLNNTEYDIYEMEGFEMIADKFPKIGTKLTDIMAGFRFHPFNKSTIFNPKVDITFLNAHLRYSPVTNVDMTGNIKLLHYRSLGLDMMFKRNDRMISRLPKGYNGHHAESVSQVKTRFKDWTNKASNVI